MIRLMSIKFKIILLATLVSVVVLLVTYLIMANAAEKIEKNIYASSAASLNSTYLDKMNTKMQVGITNVVSFSNDPVIISSLLSGDRQAVINRLSGISDLFKKNTEYKNIKIHVHTADYKSFVRSWAPEKYGEDLSKTRPSVKMVKAEKRIVAGFEVGNAGFALRSIAPVMKNGDYIGAVEFIQGLNSVAKELSASKKSMVLLMNKDLIGLAPDLASAPTVGSYVLAQKTDSEDILNLVRENLSLFDSKESYLMTDKYFITVLPVADISGKNVGAVLLGEDSGIIKHSLDQSEHMIKVALIAVFVTIVVINAVIILLLIVFFRPVDIVSEKMREFAQQNDSDVSKRIPLEEVAENKKVGSETYLLSKNFNSYLDKVESEMLENLANISNAMQCVVPMTETIMDVASVISATEDLARQVATASEEMSATINDISSNVAGSADKAGQCVKLAEDGRKAVGGVCEVAESIDANVGALVEEVNSLREKTEQIRLVISVISDISDQTNLLALNAAIEAARAGEAGRGFAVVADEVRKLSEKTKQSLDEISSTVRNILESVESADSKSKGVAESIVLQGRETENTRAKFEEISASVEELNGLIISISSAVEEQSVVTEQITQNIAMTAEHTAKVSENMDKLYEGIGDMQNAVVGLSEKAKNTKMSKKAQIFLLAKIAHIVFVSRILKHLTGKTVLTSLDDHKNCAFGKMYYSDSCASCASDPDFKALEPLHVKVHDLGRQLIKEYNSGDRQSLEKDFKELTACVTSLLRVLDKLAAKN
ncbi:MAG: methyl-accepting chemotaxis protein [Deferribacterales bacterium]